MEGNWISCAERHSAFRGQTKSTGGSSAASKAHDFALRTLRRRGRSSQSAKTSVFRILMAPRQREQAGPRLVWSRRSPNALMAAAANRSVSIDANSMRFGATQAQGWGKLNPALDRNPGNNKRAKNRLGSYPASTSSRDFSRRLASRWHIRARRRTSSKRVRLACHANDPDCASESAS